MRKSMCHYFAYDCVVMSTLVNVVMSMLVNVVMCMLVHSGLIYVAHFCCAYDCMYWSHHLKKRLAHCMSRLSHVTKQ